VQSVGSTERALRRDIHTGFAINHLQSCPVSATTGGLTIQRSRQAADPVAFRTMADFRPLRFA
jgi:hypothetical protein